jgi:hypothetical protein
MGLAEDKSERKKECLILDFVPMSYDLIYDGNIKISMGNKKFIILNMEE